MKNIFKKIVISIITWQSRLVLKKYKPKIIAITGSVGKTSTKDAIYTVLSQFVYVRKIDKSYDADIAVPLTILGLGNGWNNPFLWIANILEGFMLLIKKNIYPEYLILELGADRPGAIKNITKWISPDVVIITRLPDVPVHVEAFPNVDAVIEEKRALAESVKKDGILILNFDDTKVMELKEKIKVKTINFGMNSGAMLQASNEELWYENKENQKQIKGMNFKLEYDGNALPVSVSNIVGINHVYAALGALSVAYALNLNMIDSIQSMKNYITPPGRLHLLSGIKGSLIIDDSYNSSPVACESALITLKNIEVTGRRIAILGDMLELGKHTLAEHEKIGEITKDYCDILITVGVRAEHMYEGAMRAGFPKQNLFHLDEAQQAGLFIQNNILPGDLILIKGSQGMRMERTVLELMANPEDFETLLVRQDKEWLNR